MKKKSLCWLPGFLAVWLLISPAFAQMNMDMGKMVKPGLMRMLRMNSVLLFLTCR